MESKPTAYEVRADNGLHGYADDRDAADELARQLMGRPDVLSVTATPLRNESGRAAEPYSIRAAPCPTTDDGSCVRDCHACYRLQARRACAPCVAAHVLSVTVTPLRSER